MAACACACCARARWTCSPRCAPGATLEDLRQIILDGIWYKPWGHGLAEGVIPLNRVMSEIGG